MTRMTREGIDMFALWLAVLLLALLLLALGYFVVTVPLVMPPPPSQHSYVLDPQGNPEVGRVVVDPVPIPVSASGLALSRVGVKVKVDGTQEWVEYREAIVSSVNPPRTGDWVQCLTYYDYHEGIRMRRTTTVCNIATEEH